MNFHKLEVLMVDRGIKSIPKLAEKIGISKKTLYSRFHGQTDFTNSEIKAIKTALSLSDKEVLSIFFAS